MAANYAELQRLKYEPHFELRRDHCHLAVMDTTDERARVYDSKWAGVIHHELIRNYCLVNGWYDRQLPMPTDHKNAQYVKQNEHGPPWGQQAWDRVVSDLTEYIIPIDGQDEWM